MTGAALATRSIWSKSVALAAESPQPGSADWSRYGFDLHNTRFNGQENTLGRENVDRLKLKWRHQIGAPIQSTPLVIGDTLFVGAWDVRSCTLMRRAFSSTSSPMKSSKRNRSHALSNFCSASSRGAGDKIKFGRRGTSGLSPLSV